jgi:hypothetical protein
VAAKKSAIFATFLPLFAAVLVYISSFLELHVLHVLWVKKSLAEIYAFCNVFVNRWTIEMWSEFYVKAHYIF